MVVVQLQTNSLPTPCPCPLLHPRRRRRPQQQQKEQQLLQGTHGAATKKKRMKRNGPCLWEIFRSILLGKIWPNCSNVVERLHPQGFGMSPRPPIKPSRLPRPDDPVWYKKYVSIPPSVESQVSTRDIKPVYKGTSYLLRPTQFLPHYGCIILPLRYCPRRDHPRTIPLLRVVASQDIFE